MTNKQKAKKLLDLFGSKGEHWTTGAFARNKQGKPVANERASEAVRWCLIGACNKLKFGETWLDNAVLKYTDEVSVVGFNDLDGFKPVKTFLQRIAGVKTKTKTKEKTK
jgi:hypothetical protein